MCRNQKPEGFGHGALDAPTQKPQHARVVFLWIERLLLAFGLSLLAAYGAAQFEQFHASRAALEEFSALETADAVEVQNGEANTGSEKEAVPPLVWNSHQVDFSLWSDKRIRAYKKAAADESAAPLAVLRISKIRLEVPVLDGTDDLTLNHAVGRIRGTARPGEPGNIGIAGHRDGFFRGLKDIRVGDAVEMKTLKGTDTYMVDQIQVVAMDDVDVLQPRSVPSLTLVTCYPFYFIGSAPERYIVTASLFRETESGSVGKSESGPLSQISSSKRRNNEQSK